MTAGVISAPVTFWRAWAREALAAGTVLGESGARAIGARADQLRVTTGEQSNTSVVLPAPVAETTGSAVQPADDGLRPRKQRRCSMRSRLSRSAASPARKSCSTGMAIRCVRR